MGWIESDNPNAWATGQRFWLDQPAPTMMAAGMAGDSLGHWHIVEDGMPRDGEAISTDKPPYRVPSMEEIRAIPWNGLKVASLFAGGGGSSTGYRMAGCRVVYANEASPSARATYAANMDPATILDGRDVRQVTAEDIMKATGLARGELDILDGSPPCVSFSTAGKRQKGWGRVTASHELTQRHDDLFHEYARILKDLQPRAFVAENVSGLVKGVAKGHFLEILRALRKCGYQVRARLLDAQWLGVPQMRQRIIFVGLRNDLRREPAHPGPLPYRYSVREAIPWICGVRTDRDTWKPGEHVPSPTILAADARATHDTTTTGRSGNHMNRPHGYVEARVVHDTGHPNDPGSRKDWNCGDVTDRPSPAVAAGSNHLRVEARVVHDDSYGHPRDVTREPSPVVRSGRSGTHHVDAFVEPTIEGANGFNRHRRGSTRKPAATVQAGRTLNIDEFGNKATIGGNFSGRTVASSEPSPTVLTCHNGFNEIAVASSMPRTERRKFTIEELKRICSFPDDYAMRGTYAEQWARCGDAVPPVMMAHVARALIGKLK